MSRFKECPSCKRLVQESVNLCDACGEDLSEVTPMEAAADTACTEASKPPLAEAESGVYSSTMPEPKDAILPENEDIPPSGTDMPGASDAENVDSQNAERRCQCTDQTIRRVTDGRQYCIPCGGFIENAQIKRAGITDEATEKSCADGEKLSDGQAETIPEADQEVTIGFPWGERHKFSKRIVLGRARHPDQNVGSLPESIRARLQSEYLSVSRFHALVTVHDGGRVSVEPLEPLNGLFVNGHLVMSDSVIIVPLPCKISLGKQCELSIEEFNG